MTQPVVDILMYHSISESAGPTSISPAIFASQMAAIAEAKVPVIRLEDVLAARKGRLALPAQSVVITFDDGFRDFSDVAFPILKQHGFSAIVYLPTAQIGRSENWLGANRPARPLMDWGTIRNLSAAGVDFGSHSVSHPDLCSLTSSALTAELSQSRRILEDRLGKKIVHFAPPYGGATPAVRAEIARHYGTSVGTRLARARPGDDLHDLPRLEMFYFAGTAAWRNHLRNLGGTYLFARQTLRRIKNLVVAPWEGQR